MVLKVADRWTNGRMDAPGDDNRHPPKFWLRPKNDCQSAILDFISAKFITGYPYESLHFVPYAWSNYFALILSCVNITKLLKLKMAARQPFQVID